MLPRSNHPRASTVSSTAEPGEAVLAPNVNERFWAPYVFRASALAAAACTQVLLVRHLGPDRIGASAFAITMAGYFSGLVSLHVDQELIRRFWACKTQAEQGRLVADATYARAVVALGFVLIIPVILSLFERAVAYWIYALACLTATLPIVAGGWVLQAKGRMATLQFAALCQPATMLIASGLAFGLFPPFVGEDVVISFCGAVVFGVAVRWRDRGLAGSQFRNVGRYLSWYFGLLRTAKWILVCGVLAMLYASVELALIAKYLGLPLAGAYRSAQVLAIAGQGAVGIYCAQCAFQMREIPTMKPQLASTAFASIFSRTILLMAGLGILAFWLTRDVHRILYGDAYRAADHAAALLVLAKVVSMVSGVCIALLVILRREVQVVGALLAATAVNVSVFMHFRRTLVDAALANLWAEILLSVTLAVVCFGTLRLRVRGGDSATI